MIDRHILRDHASLGDTHHAGFLNTQLPHGCDLILGHLPDRVAFRHLILPAEHIHSKLFKVLPVLRAQNKSLPLYRGKSVRQSGQDHKNSSAAPKRDIIHIRTAKIYTSVLRIDSHFTCLLDCADLPGEPAVTIPVLLSVCGT